MSTVSNLERSMAAAGKTLERFQTPDGSQLCLLPYGARVLALCPPNSDESFYWRNTPLDDADSARKLFAGDGWHNTGGDRTWISPELDTFFPDTTFSRYWQPRPLDMSDYAVHRVGGGIQLSREMRLHLARPNSDADLRLTKWFGPAANPLRHERDMASANRSLQYAGYTQRVLLQSTTGASAPVPNVGIWNLMQLPPGGDLLVPLYSPADVQLCFGNIPAGRIVLSDHLMRVNKVDFTGSHKIAVKASSLCGRTGYVYPQGDCWSLAIRNFFVNLSGQYIDVQRQDPEDFGYAFQMCRVDEPEFGSFCEMEYHAPGLGALPQATESLDVSQVWAFRGSRDSIAAVAKKLLGVEL
jgi:hypothetical protein